MNVQDDLDRSPWGQAWIDALEHQSGFDATRLPRGRTYARRGRVFGLDTGPGTVRTYVEGSLSDPYQVELGLRTFSDEEWRTVFEVIVSRAEHTAALIDGELEPTLVEDLTTAGIDLLPKAGEISFRCSCPDVAGPCKHAAAACYQVAEELDDDPFVLLQLRGRTRDQILAAVRRLRTESVSRPERDDTKGPARPRQPADEGMSATEAWARPLGALPSSPPPRPLPAQPAALSADPPPDAIFTTDGLQSLAADAATRAWAALTEGASLDLDIALDDDIVRRAVTARHRDDFAVVAERLGAKPEALSRRAAAWELAGHDGLDMLNEPQWQVDPLVMSAARLEVEKVLRGHVRGDIDGNRLTLGDTQLRLSHTGQWWSFQKRSDVWEPSAGPVDSPADLVDPRPGGRR